MLAEKYPDLQGADDTVMQNAVCEYVGMMTVLADAVNDALQEQKELYN
jgi:hypothetical protein